MSEISPVDPKFAKAREAYLQATALRVQIDRGELGALKRDLFAYFEANAILGQHCPDRPWFGHGSTEPFLAAVDAAAAAVTGLSNEVVLRLVAEITELQAAAELLAAAVKGKRAAKESAVAYLERHESRSLGAALSDGARSVVGRKTHMPSRTIVERLRALASGTPAERLAHVAALAPIAEKTALKARIAAVFESADYRSVFGSEGVFGVRSHIRAAHAPLLDMRRALDRAAAALALVADAPKREAVIAELAAFRQRLTLRKSMKAALVEYEAKAAEMRASFAKNGRSIVAFAGSLEASIAELGRTITEEQRSIETARVTLVAKKRELDALFLAHERSLEGFEAGLDAESGSDDAPVLDLVAVRALEAAIATLERTIDTAIARIETTEIAIAEKVKVLTFCNTNVAAIERYRTQLAEEHAKYKEAKVLVLYFKLGDDVGDLLAKLAATLRGGDAALDAIGSMNVVLIFEAGVRAGVDLGIAALYAQVGMTLVLSGSLAILDDRRMLFTSRLALYLGLGAKAEVGIPEPLAEVGEGMSLPIPDTLLEASVSARCSLYDVQSCTLYLDEAHWGAHWSHAITRRIVFLNRYTPREGGLVTAEWLDAKLASFGDALGASETLTREAKARIAEAIARDQAKVALLRTPASDLAFHTTTRTNWQGKLEAAGYELASRATSQVVNFAVRETLPSGVSPVATLVESVTLFTAGELAGQAAYHKVTPPALVGGSPRHYLEITQRRSNSATLPSVSIAWSQAMPEPPRSPGALAALSRAVNVAGSTLAREGVPRAPVPVEATREVPVADAAGFEHELGARLALVASGGEASKLLQSILAAPGKAQTLAEGAGTVGSQLGVGALSSAAESLGSLAESAQAITDLVSLGASSSAYVRYTDQPRSRIDATNALVFDRAWTPQVFRGMRYELATIAPPTATVPIIPGLDAYFGFELRFKREVSQYEVLGTGTFSYLKALWKAVTKRGPGAGSSQATARLDAYVELHNLELTELLRAVTVTQSGPSDELVFDAIAGGAVAATAIALGDACFQHFAPSAANPFLTLRGKRIGNPSELATWAREALRARLALAATLRDSLTAANLRAAERDLAALPPELGRVASGYDATVTRLLERLDAFEAKFNASVTHKEPVTDRVVLRANLAAMRAAIGDLAAVTREVSGAIEALGVLEDHAATPALLTRAQALLPLVDSALRGVPPLKVQGRTLGHFFDLDATFATRFNETAAAKLSDKPRLYAEWQENPSGPWALFVRSLYGREEAAGSPLCTLVPTRATWKADRGIPLRGVFQFASTETRTLLDALDFHHSGPPTLTPNAPARDEATYAELLGYLRARIERLTKLLAAIDTWKLRKDDATSKRMPNVVMLVEVPALKELAALQAALVQGLLRWHLRALLTHRARLAPAAGVSLPSSTRMPLTAELRAKLKAYLEAAPDTARYDALMHGIKQISLPGDDPAVVDASVAETSPTATA